MPAADGTRPVAVGVDPQGALSSIPALKRTRQCSTVKRRVLVMRLRRRLTRIVRRLRQVLVRIETIASLDSRLEKTALL